MRLVAEIGGNHLGSLPRALELVKSACQAGADAVKFQCWSPDSICVDSHYTLGIGPWAGRRLSDLYRETFTPWEWFPELFAAAREHGAEPFASAFDNAAVDFLDGLGVATHKIASFELVDLPLIRYAAGKGRHLILSTGMATREEIEAAVDAAYAAKSLTLLHCVSSYPAPVEEMNLETIRSLRRNYGGYANIGLSDHSEGFAAPVIALALGATMVEKHYTLSRADGGPDAGFSMEPAEFKQMVTECRRAAAAIGVPSYGPGPNESTELRRSLWVIRDTAQGQPLILGHNVATARPAKGLPPSTPLTTAARTLWAGTPLIQECIT